MAEDEQGAVLAQVLWRMDDVGAAGAIHDDVVCLRRRQFCHE